MLTLIWYRTRRLGNSKDSVSSAMKTRGAQFWLLTVLMGSRWVCLLSGIFPLCRVSVSFPSWWLQAQEQYWSAGLQSRGDILTGKWSQEIIHWLMTLSTCISFPHLLASYVLRSIGTMTPHSPSSCTQPGICFSPFLPHTPLSFLLWKVNSLSRVRLFATPWTVAYQAPPSMGFSRQEYWSGLPFPSPGDLPDPGIESRSPALEADALSSEWPGKLYWRAKRLANTAVSCCPVSGNLGFYHGFVAEDLAMYVCHMSPLT